MRKSLVVCIGNRLIGDDAAGPLVFDALSQSTLPDTTRLVLLETRGIALLDELMGEALLVVVDATRLGALPGTIHRLSLDELNGAARMPVTSHDIALADALKVGAVLYPERMPKEVLFIGIEGESFNLLGAPLSPAVAEAVTTAVEEIREALSPRVASEGAPQPMF